MEICPEGLKPCGIDEEIRPASDLLGVRLGDRVSNKPRFLGKRKEKEKQDGIFCYDE
jgi:hypothetical protein